MRMGLLLALAFLAGCAGVDISDYAKEKPVFDLASYFNDTGDGWGMVQNRSGKVNQRFYVCIDGRVEGNRLTLDEHLRVRRWKEGTQDLATREDRDRRPL